MDIQSFPFPLAEGGLCNYIILDKKGKGVSARIGGNCHGWQAAKSMMGSENADCYIIFKVDNSPYPADCYEPWAKFLTSIHMPVEYTGTSTFNTQINYDQVYGTYHMYKIDMSKIESDVHCFATITAARMINYYYKDTEVTESYRLVPYGISRLLAVVKDIDPMEAFLIGHMIVPDYIFHDGSKWCSASFIANHLVLNYHRFMMFSSDEFLERIKTAKEDVSCNELFNFGTEAKENKNYHSLLVTDTEESILECYKLIKNGLQ